MCENDYSFLIENGFPYLVEFLHSEKVDDLFEITADIELCHFHLWPALAESFVKILISCIDEFVVVEI